MRLIVTGMSCGHCEAAVREALHGVSGVVEVVRVAAADGVAELRGTPDPAAVIAAIRDAGYDAEVAA